MECIHPLALKGKGIVPCGKCLPCLARKRDAWVVRLKEELKTSSSCFFITLTYDDDHVPISYVGDEKIQVLNKRDVQLWLKRLRKMIEPHKVRYFLTSEYGLKTFRPHYHLLLFNFPKNFDIYETVVKTWKNGFVMVDKITDARIYYVAKYVTSPSLLPDYLLTKRNRPFTLSSRRGAIGCGYLTDAKVRYHRETLANYVTLRGGVKVALPRYYRDKIFDDDMKAILNEQSEQFRLAKNLEYERKNEKYYRDNPQVITVPLQYQEAEQEMRRLKDKLYKQSKI